MTATRDRIVGAAARLLREEGPGALSTRAVAQAAGAQAPAIYRLFGDKDGLLDAVAEHVLATYVQGKSADAAEEDGDPVAALRAAWDRHVAFGLANGAVFQLLVDPARPRPSAAAVAGLDVLRARVARVAAAGRLRVAEARAVALIHAAGTGAVLTQLAAAPEDRDLALAGAMYDAVAAAVLTDAPAAAPGDAVAAAVTFRTVVDDLPALSAGERALLREWLDRAAG